MTRYVRIALALAAALVLAACVSGGMVDVGYDAESPGASHGDWCSHIPPSPYCGVRDSN